jgi:Nucleotidyl transferase AbiEii toxin, Type IV TA system
MTMKLGKKEKSLENVLTRLIKASILPDDCYLAEGTAVFLRLHHRISVDLDFFSPRPFNSEILVFRLREEFAEVEVELMEQGTLIAFLSSDKVKFSLFHLPYQLLAPRIGLEIGPGMKASLASFDDLEAMKALALIQRGSAKDFIDLFYLLKQTGHSFADLSRLIQRKYDLDQKYDYHLKTAMVYFDDAEKEIETIMMVGESGGVRSISKKEWNGIKDYFVRFCR